MQGFDVFRTQHHHSFVAYAHAIAPHRGQGLADATQYGLAALGRVFAYSTRRLRGEERERALFSPQSSIDLKRLPRALFFIFRDARCELAGIAKSRHVDAIRPGATHVQQNQLQGAAQRTVGAGDVAEHVLSRPETKLLSNRTIDDNQRSREVRRSEERRVGKECRSRWSPY